MIVGWLDGFKYFGDAGPFGGILASRLGGQLSNFGDSKTIHVFRVDGRWVAILGATRACEGSCNPSGRLSVARGSHFGSVSTESLLFVNFVSSLATVFFLVATLRLELNLLSRRLFSWTANRCSALSPIRA